MSRAGRRTPAAAALLIAPLVALAAPARADIAVSGDASALEVEVTSESTQDVVAAIGAELGIHLAPPPEVEEGTVSGVYRGSLATVLRALMPRASFVVTRRTGDARGLSVRFLGAPADEPTSGARRADADAEDDPQAGGPPVDRRPPGRGDEDFDDPQAKAAKPPPARQVY